MNYPFDYEPEDAFHGPAGELAKRLEKHVPMNILALYCALLVAIGTVVGRRAISRYVCDDHFANLFLIMVGKTGCGKGTSWNVINNVMSQIHPAFPSLVPSDSASAPGLIHLVRDPSEKECNGRIIKDEGVKDKRRLVLFEEMEILFASMSRPGATLDQTWRLAWAGRTLENNTKKGQERATNPHLSTICQITPEALHQALQKMGKQCSTSGFINRFMIVPVTRDRSLHRTGPLPDVQDLVTRIRQAVDLLGPLPQTNPPVEIPWSQETFLEWDAFCEAIDYGDPFLEGVEAAYGRLKPMVMRVAMLLAVIDSESQIRLAHLRAAKALCLHLVDSSRAFFTTTIARRSPSARDRLMTFSPSGDFGMTDLQGWIKTKFPKGGQPANDDLHRLIDDFVTEGFWHSAHRTEYSKHRGWRFTVADHCNNLTASADVDQPGDAKPLPEPEQPLAESEAEAKAYYLGAAFPVGSPIEGLTLEDRPFAVPKGAQGHLVQLPTSGTGKTHNDLLALQAKKKHHRLVCIDGELLLLPRKPVLAWATAAKAEMQVA